MSIEKEINTALCNDALLVKLLVEGTDSIFEGYAPDKGVYPMVVFSNISDVPVMAADDREMARQVTIQISIITEFGDYEEMEARIKVIMEDLGFARLSSITMREQDARMRIIRYVIGLEE